SRATSAPYDATGCSTSSTPDPTLSAPSRPCRPLETPRRSVSPAQAGETAAPRVLSMEATHVDDDLVKILFTEAQIQERLGEMAQQIAADYEGKDLLLVGILRGAVMVMADLSRALPRHVEMDWIAISSYGSGTKSSGVVRLLKDLDTDITGRHVLIVD